MNEEPRRRLGPEEIRSQLSQCIGTIGYYRHPFGKGMVFTDGVKLFADLCQAYWLIDILMTEPVIRKQAEEFAFVTLDVKGGSGEITVVADIGLPPVFRLSIEATDCPEGRWQFYMTDNVILLPSEY